MVYKCINLKVSCFNELKYNQNITLWFIYMSNIMYGNTREN